LEESSLNDKACPDGNHQDRLKKGNLRISFTGRSSRKKKILLKNTKTEK
jgi:hypothetical protein